MIYSQINHITKMKLNLRQAALNKYANWRHYLLMKHYPKFYVKYVRIIIKKTLRIFFEFRNKTYIWDILCKKYNKTCYCIDRSKNLNGSLYMQILESKTNVSKWVLDKYAACLLHALNFIDFLTFILVCKSTTQRRIRKLQVKLST